MSTLAMRRNLSGMTTTTAITNICCRRASHSATPRRSRCMQLWETQGGGIGIINCPSSLQRQNVQLQYRYQQPLLQFGLPQRASFSSTTNKSESTDVKARLTTLRLYRILHRQCMALSQNNSADDEAILIQPQLRAPDWGRHSKFMIPTTTSISDLYRLFYSVFEDDDDDDDNEEDGKRNVVDPFYSSSSLSFRGSIQHWYNDICVVHPPAEPNGIPLVATCWTSVSQLRQAIREAFRAKYSATMDPRHLRKWAIHANQLLQQQDELWKHSSVVTTENIRIVATSRCIGVTASAKSFPPTTIPSMLENKYRFSYRIRIENISPDPEAYVQLLGRHWNVQELEDGESVSSSSTDSDADGVGPVYRRKPVTVAAPYTGAVGHLPVLRPGQCFEYMSGTDLATTRGMMTGKFYMARVPPGTPSAKTGDTVQALQLDNNKFQVNIATFPLVV